MLDSLSKPHHIRSQEIVAISSSFCVLFSFHCVLMDWLARCCNLLMHLTQLDVIWIGWILHPCYNNYAYTFAVSSHTMFFASHRKQLLVLRFLSCLPQHSVQLLLYPTTSRKSSVMKQSLFNDLINDCSHTKDYTSWFFLLIIH